MKNKKNLKIVGILLSVILCVGCFTACMEDVATDEQTDKEATEIVTDEEQPQESTENTSEEVDQDTVPTQKTSKSISLSSIPKYSGQPYVTINGNKPKFKKSEHTTKAFETYSNLDNYGRCGVAYANICRKIMPKEERGSIGQVKPTGWHTIRYNNVDGKYLYNRCHLIGFQLAGENANRKNLITGTRYLNVDGMLPFENMVADYVEETNHHVLYRVTPIYRGTDLVARGVQMEAYSVEDHGDGICFNVYVYNVQPGIIIYYSDGSSKARDGSSPIIGGTSNNGNYNGYSNSGSTSDKEIRGNKRSKIYHCPGQRDYNRMKTSKNLIVFKTEAAAKRAGYRKAKL